MLQRVKNSRKYLIKIEVCCVLVQNQPTLEGICTKAVQLQKLRVAIKKIRTEKVRLKRCEKNEKNEIIF